MKEVWTKALEGMPHMALLRNLRNLIENDVDVSLYIDKLKNGVEGGKQLCEQIKILKERIEKLEGKEK